MRFPQFINFKGLKVASYKVIVTVGIIVTLISDAKNLVVDLFGREGDEKTEESMVSKPADTDYIEGIDSLKTRTEGEPRRTFSNQTQATTFIKKQEPKLVEQTYFNKAEVILDENALAIFIIKSTALDRKFCQKLSIELQNKNINNSISFFNNQSLPHYSSFFTGNKEWLSQIKIANYLNTYLIGELIEEHTASSYDAEMTIIDISFSGKLVNINNNTSIPVEAHANVSSYNKKEALNEAYDAVVNDIVLSTKSIM